jgi:quercetin dioxygenase-like cupin family protein
MTDFIDLARQAGENHAQGALWGIESHDLDCTLVAWTKGKGVAKHTNDEVDVVMIVMEGRALVELPGKDQQLMQGQLLLIRKGTSRRIEALSDRLVYVNVHKRRKLMGLKDRGDYEGRSEPR